jgi:hypothetical protein
MVRAVPRPTVDPNLPDLTNLVEDRHVSALRRAKIRELFGILLALSGVLILVGTAFSLNTFFGLFSLGLCLVLAGILLGVGE